MLALSKSASKVAEAAINSDWSGCPPIQKVAGLIPMSACVNRSADVQGPQAAVLRRNYEGGGGGGDSMI